MRSLGFEDSHAGVCTVPPEGFRGRLAWALGLLAAAIACGGGGDDGAETVSLADSGTLAALTSSNLDIPTAVAVRDNVAWIAESQFDHYADFGGAGSPGGFRIVGVPLAGGTVQFITLPDNYFPEGIAVSLGNRLYIGSVADGSIYTVAPNSTTAQLFVPPKTLAKPSVLGMAVSADGQTLWVCNTVTAAPAGTLPSAAIVGIGAADGQVKATHELPPSAAGAFCNDIAIAANGNLWATESFGGRLFRIAAADLNSNAPATAWLQASELSGPNGPEVNRFGANGLALMSGKLFVVNSSRGTLLSIDPTLEAPGSADLHVVTLEESGVADSVLLANPDGIRRLSDTDLLIVESGFFIENEKVVEHGGKRLTQVTLKTQ
jgi:sugar lactone lactonase YvrE